MSEGIADGSNSMAAGVGQPTGMSEPSSGMTSGQIWATSTPSGGAGNSATGMPSRAAFMKAVQMAAGKEPPVTVPRPPVPESETP